MITQDLKIFNLYYKFHKNTSQNLKIFQKFPRLAISLHQRHWVPLLLQLFEHRVCQDDDGDDFFCLFHFEGL